METGTDTAGEKILEEEIKKIGILRADIAERRVKLKGLLEKKLANETKMEEASIASGKVVDREAEINLSSGRFKRVAELVLSGEEKLHPGTNAEEELLAEGREIDGELDRERDAIEKLEAQTPEHKKNVRELIVEQRVGLEELVRKKKENELKRKGLRATADENLSQETRARLNSGRFRGFAGLVVFMRTKLRARTAGEKALLEEKRRIEGEIREKRKIIDGLVMRTLEYKIKECDVALESTRLAIRVCKFIRWLAVTDYLKKLVSFAASSLFKLTFGRILPDEVAKVIEKSIEATVNALTSIVENVLFSLVAVISGGIGGGIAGSKREANGKEIFTTRGRVIGFLRGLVNGLKAAIGSIFSRKKILRWINDKDIVGEDLNEKVEQLASQRKDLGERADLDKKVEQQLTLEKEGPGEADAAGDVDPAKKAESATVENIAESREMAEKGNVPEGGLKEKEGANELSLEKGNSDPETSGTKEKIVDSRAENEETLPETRKDAGENIVKHGDSSGDGSEKSPPQDQQLVEKLLAATAIFNTMEVEESLELADKLENVSTTMDETLTPEKDVVVAQTLT
ncbi:MAG: hypothetical protein LBU15_02465 [Rickettsiales bacterium]|jgi:hypothetical protein|nr:hypothetical protein [Rickettsiales bacterium]